MGTSINLTGGATNTLGGFALTQVPTQRFLSFYGAFPTITVNTKGEHSALDASYAYGFERTGNFNAQSHAGSFSLSKTLNPRWTTGLSDHFVSSTDTSAFNALRNVSSDPTNTIFVFSPVTGRLTSRNNSATLTASDQYTDRSSLAFSLTHTFINYGSADGSFGSALLNQQQIAGNIAYNYKSGLHETWTLGYNAQYFTFSQSQNGFSQNAQAGYSTNVLRDFTLSITAGIAESSFGGGNSVGLISSVSIGKTFKKNEVPGLEKILPSSETSSSSFRLYFTQSSGGSTGLGTLSNVRQAGLSLHHTGRHINEFLDVSAFDTHGILGNDLGQRAAMATASLGLNLSKQWSAQVGGFYQAYDHNSAFAFTNNPAGFGFTEKRVFVSLQYNHPNLWTGPR